MDSVLIRVDAGPVVGMGHLQRCLSLAVALRQMNASVLFMTNGDSVSEVRIERFGFDSIAVSESDSWTERDSCLTVKQARSRGCSVIVVDSDRKGPDYLSYLFHEGFYVCAIDDNAPHIFPCHLVVNGNIHACQLDYKSPFEDTQFLLGARYSILRPEFCEPLKRVYGPSVDTILVMLGGADPHGIMPDILSALDRVDDDFKVKAVIGPFFSNRAAIEESVQDLKRPIEFVYDPDQVRPLMVEADIAISGGGQTLYELAASGCPALAIRIAANQDVQLSEFAKSGFISLIGDANNSEIGYVLVERLEALIRDYGQRKNMVEAGRKIADGGGAMRVAEFIAQS